MPTHPRNVAVITGASSGIGESAARALARDGLSLALLARRKDRIESLADELSTDAVTAIAVEADVTDRDSLGRAAAQVSRELGDADAKQGAEQMYADNAISAEEVADVIAFGVERPVDVSLNEILIRPTGQAR